MFGQVLWSSPRLWDCNLCLGENTRWKINSGSAEKKWFGVRGSGLLMSFEVYVRGREFMLASISQVKVDNVSCVSVLDPMTLYKDNLNTWINFSQLPPKCGARGGLNLHSISISRIWSFEANSFDALSASIPFFSSEHELTKDFPLSERKFFLAFPSD